MRSVVIRIYGFQLAAADWVLQSVPKDEYTKFVETLAKENPPATREDIEKHPDVTKRVGFYRSDLIFKIIYARFFAEGELSDAGQFPELFNPAKGIPLGLIALVATLVRVLITTRT